MPSTRWQEDFRPGEGERHVAAARDIVAMQRRKSEQFGRGRALHRKGTVAALGRLTVAGGLPAHAAHGLFAQPGEHPVWVRFSNGGVDVQSDRRPDIRGFAFRVFDVRGEAALGGVIDHQDFSLINQTRFAFPTSELFVPLVLAAGRSPGALLAWFFRTFGPLGALKQLKEMGRTFKRRFTGYATESFSSVLPIACGPYACKVRLMPIAPAAPRPDAANDWGADFAAHAASGPVRYTLQLQFFEDEARTPIEDASVEWPESVAPWLIVGELAVNAPSRDKVFTQQVERGVFDPWQALAAHRPLGEVMRARKVVYFESEKARGASI
ncbi:MAG: catalase [Inhella sp.]|jgi:hypothetical protein|uniref:catalase n=1 Tax=Inhella sp. TaxID=1921806 RepID=UPI00391998CC